MSFYNFKCNSNKNHPTFTVSILMSQYDTISKIVKCPVCSSSCSRMMAGERKHGYIRGNCYLDSTGARRDMNKFTLQNDDPYDHMRQNGEVDDMITRIEKAGKKENSPEYNIGQDTLYKVCPSCHDTLSQDLFYAGSKGRCVDCTPKEERSEYKSYKEADKEWLLNAHKSKEEREKEFAEKQKKEFEKEYGVDL